MHVLLLGGRLFGRGLFGTLVVLVLFRRAVTADGRWRSFAFAGAKAS